MTQSNVSRVLVVDDEAEICQLLAEALAGSNVEVRTAGSGEKALEVAREHRPDLLITDLCLGDCNGLDVIDGLRATCGEVPAVVITGHGTAKDLAEASRRRPVELMTKPLDLDRLCGVVRGELSRRRRDEGASRRSLRLRKFAHHANLQRKEVSRKLETATADLTAAYQDLSRQMTSQQLVLDYQKELLSARTDDDVFRNLFRLFVSHSGGVFGAAMVCDEDAELHVVGRFGVPQPDSLNFCRMLARPLVGQVIANPRVMLTDAYEEADVFDASIRKYLCGVSILAIPLIPSEGELIGLVILYRKGEQPFTDEDLKLAQLISAPTAVCVRRND